MGIRDLFATAKDHTANVNVDSDAISLNVEKGKTLLNAALGAGLDWPHKCKVGSCGTCRCQIVSGKIKPQIDFGYVLSSAELDKGYVLACQSELKADVEVRVKFRKLRTIE